MVPVSGTVLLQIRRHQKNTHCSDLRRKLLDVGNGSHLKTSPVSMKSEILILDQSSQVVTLKSIFQSWRNFHSKRLFCWVWRSATVAYILSKNFVQSVMWKNIGDHWGTSKLKKTTKNACACCKHGGVCVCVCV